MLGGKLETEISFQLPCVRIEHVRAGRHRLGGMTAITPTTNGDVEVNHVIYWTMPWLSAIKPILIKLTEIFLDQDRQVFIKQQQGLANDPPLMLINDADMLAKWYYQLKREHTRAEAEGLTNLKGHRSVVHDGQSYTINLTGNPGMATGGAGDVLTGVVASLLGQGLGAFPAACLGAHLHGLAGDLAARDRGMASLTAGDLVEFLPAAFRDLRRGET